MEIFKEFTFEAAHRLPNVPAGHKCARLHGHSFRVSRSCARTAGGGDGLGAGLRRTEGRLCPAAPPVLDHNYLNEIPGLENPTSEEIARWIWQRLQPASASALSAFLCVKPARPVVFMKATEQIHRDFFWTYGGSVVQRWKLHQL